jgi:hypothetical protein
LQKAAAAALFRFGTTNWLMKSESVAYQIASLYAIATAQN